MIVTRLNNVREPTRFVSITIQDALEYIKNSDIKQQVDKLRAIDRKNNEALYSNEKKKLPCFSFNGTFEGNVTNDNFVQSSGLFSFDIDHLTDAQADKNIISTIPGVVFCFLSPGGEGLKGAIRINPDKIKNDADFKKAFKFFDRHFKSYGYDIDQSRKDVRGLCFASFDESPFINFDAKVIDFYEKSIDIEGICIDRIANLMQGATNGHRHNIRLKAGKLAGGFVSGGMISESKMMDILMQYSDIISDNGVTSDSEQKTIIDGFNEGLKSPIENVYTKKRTTLETKRRSNVNIADFVADSNLLKRMSIQASAQTNLPISTVLLMGLSIYSSMASRKYCVAYEYGGRFPIGIYAVCEHPPGTAKTWCLRIFQDAFYRIYTKIYVFDSSLKPSLFITNSTAEGLEVTLENSKGFFSAASSEQGLFNALFGASYTNGERANNNDVTLNGFDGGYINSKRVGREGYNGRVCGSITCFAQQGSIESILNASNGTGLGERFLMLSEDHNLGKRDHTKKIAHDNDLISDYDKACEFIEDVIKDPKSFDDLEVLKISSEGFLLINKYRNSIEPFLADGGKYSSPSLRGSAGKVNMQIIKIAANLHLINNGGQYFKSNIDLEYVKQAISIADALLNEKLGLCVEKEIFGNTAEYTAIVNYLTNRPGGRTEGDIVNCMKGKKPFKDIDKERNKAIKYALDEMAENGLLAISYSPQGGKIYTMAH